MRSPFDDEARYRERPPSGESSWPNNGEIHEHARCSLLAEADKAEDAGDAVKAAELRAEATLARRQRDRCWRTHERRTIAQRARRGAF